MTFTVRWSVLRSAAKDVRHLGLAVLGLFDAFVVAAGIGWLHPMSLGDVVQTAGTILGLLGIWTTVAGLIELRGRFKGPIQASISSWFGLVAGAFKKPQNVTIQVGTMVATSSMFSPAVIVGLPPGATVDQRLSALERDVTELRTEMRSADDAQRRDIGTLTGDLQRERHAREEGDRRALQEVEGLAAGGFELAMVGVFWTLTGTLLASPVGEWAGRLLAR